jgi:hypothetical protein
MNFKQLQDLYNKIEPKEIQSLDLNVVDDYQMLLSISFCKCLQVNQIIHNSIFDKNSFLYLASIRGICEELIVLKYIDETIKNEDKSLLVQSIMKISTQKELKEQASFIGKYRPAQPVLGEKVSDFLKGEEIGPILNRNGINGTKMPSTYQMADKIRLRELYDYLYRASCSFVHFNPRVMQRTVWYQNDELNKSEISITNFHKYYYSFSSFYCSYLFGLLYKMFNDKLNLSESNSNIINEIIEVLRRTVHYPELVTFEELNLKRPKTELTVINEFLENQLFKND